ncbi:RNA polymerase sigma factor [Pengzhenrongella frigida]|uniref:RNA polymerase sigma factor n=1 Tax=Pengzhenrongella frigida TaxID=1259133 RepID=A0A4Q5N580_9MICO|nr:RNA polymerase sigma factor [Cellulomonas sp. HLT2-17]RYV52633.1 RNA polymerase sigma factor [Cellulomonas sp. HLT2-17]
MISPEERFAVLFNRTHQPLLAYSVRRVADPADAADIVAETFLVAWRRLDEVPPDEQARAWLFGVARRVLANYYRGEHRRLALGERLRTSLREVAVPPPQVCATAVEIAMERLSPDDRELLRLVAWEELAREEIAMVLQIPRATVRVRLHRARRRLLAEMQSVESDAPGVGPLKRPAVSGHVMSGRAPARPGTEEAR